MTPVPPAFQPPVAVPAAAPALSPETAPSPRWLVPGLALAYALLGQLAVLLAVPPGFAAPLYPAAGLALAAVLVYGRIALPGIVVGAVAVNGLLTLHLGQSPLVALVISATVGLGAAAQAAFGAAMVRRQLGGSLLLSEPREVLAFFFWGGPVACLVNATSANLALTALGLLGPDERLSTWWSWWSGDTLGVLIAAPLTLIAIGRPRADWAARRLSVGLPLLGAMLLLALATALVARWDMQRSHAVFDHDAEAAGTALDNQLRTASHALEAMRGLYLGSNDVSADEMRRAAAPWFEANATLQALGYAERVSREQVPQHEARVQRTDQRPGFKVFERRGPASDQAGGTSEALVIRFAEPLASNHAALGLNILSVQPARNAVLRSVDNDAATATTGFVLTQETANQTGVVVYRPLFQTDVAATQRRSQWRGAVFVTLRMQQLAEAAMAPLPGYVGWCLVDLATTAPTRRLAGPAGCEARPLAGQLLRRHALKFGQRDWELTLTADPSAVPDAGNGNALLFSTVGLVSTAVLAGMLLTVTGRARRIEAAVAERTADLRREMAERQVTEAALRESEQRFRNIVDHAPLGIAFADLDARVHESNPRLRELLGCDATTLAGLALTDLLPVDERAAEALALAPLLAGQVTEVRRRTRLQNRGGHLVSVQMMWSVLRDPDGAPRRLVAVVEDITDQMRREEAEQGRQVAESANQAKTEFLSRMSHELRTPLNAMLGFAQLLALDRQAPLNARQAGWAQHIRQAGWHLLQMINDILDLSRIESGMLRLAPGPVALAPLVEQCLAMLEPAAQQRDVHLQQVLDPAAAAALGDETRIKQVLSNLLSNAVKYNVQGGSVRVESRLSGTQHLQLRVQDSGPGLSAEQRAGLFQPFNRLGREQGPIEGTGIGLVISRRLAELMGGSLEIEAAATPTIPPAQTVGSAWGPGTTFVLTLPLAARPVAAAAAAAPPLPAPSTPGDTPRDVLYIEDNATNIEVMRGVLAHRPRLRLAVASTGAAALAALQAQLPDLVLLDMNLPDTDGVSLLGRMAQVPGCAGLPVLVVSADASPARAHQALAAGALEYLTKPLDVPRFLSLVDTLLADAPTANGPTAASAALAAEPV